MEDGIERSLHSLKEQSFEQPDEQTYKNPEEKKTLYLCYPVDKFHLDKCVITDKKEKTQDLIKSGYKVSLFIINNDNTYFNPQ